MTIYTTPPSVRNVRLFNRDVLNVNGDTAFDVWIDYGGVAEVNSGSIWRGRVSDGGKLNVFKGSVDSMTIESGGIANLYGTGITAPNFVDEGSATFTTIDGGQVNVIGGLALYTTIKSGEQSIQGKGASYYTTINGGTEVVFGTSNNAVIDSSGKQQVAYSGVTNKAVLNGGFQELAGRAFETVIERGTQFVQGAVGLADHTTVNGGLQVVRDGGTANYATIRGGRTVSGGAQRIDSGGTANNTTVEADGLQNINPGGVANYSIIKFGGSLDVSGTANFTTIDQGEAAVRPGGTTNQATIKSLGTETVNSGGVANKTIVDEGGILTVEAGATSNDTTVSGRGTERVSGVANNTTIEAFGLQRVNKGGTANGSTIEARGTQEVAGTANDTTIESGGKQTVLAGGTTHNTKFEGPNASLSMADPSGLTGAIANWQQGNVIEFANAEVASVLETAADEIVVTFTTSDHQLKQVAYTLVGEQADTHVTFVDDSEGGAKLVLEADSSSEPVATFVEIGSASAGNIAGGAIGGATSASGHVIIDIVAMKEQLASLGDDIPADWFAWVRGADDDDWIRSGSGDDSIDGAGGDDIVAYSQRAEQYTVTTIGDLIVVEDRSGHDGTDSLTDVQHLEFQGSSIDATILTSAASLSREQLGQLVELYVGYFNRAPDTLGLAYWASQMAGGMPLTQISKSFFVQPETTANYPTGMTTGDFVSTVYQNAFGRTPDQAGLAYWVNELDKGSVGRDVFVPALINGAKSPTGSADDAHYLANKEAVGVHFALDEGLSDLGWAKEVMQQVDGTEASVLAANQATDDFAVRAVTTDPHLLLPLVSSTANPVSSVKAGDWLDEATWSSHVAPNGTDVDVAISSTHTVTLDGTNTSVGTLAIGADAVLDLSNAVLSALRFANRGAIDVHDAGDLQAWIQNENFGTVEARHGGLITFWEAFANKGTVLAQGTGSIVTFKGGLNTRDGTLQARDGGEIDVTNGKSLQGNNAGKVDLIGDNSTLKILDGGRLDVEFHEGNQKLVLDRSDQFEGKVDNLEKGDQIDVLDVDFNSSAFGHDFDGATLTLVSLNHDTNIKLVGLGSGSLTFASDGHGGVLIGLA